MKYPVQFDVIVVGGPGLTRVASGSDINGDHKDDLMFGYETDNAVRILWGSSAWSLRNGATLASFNFDSSLHNFTAINQNSNDPLAANVNWHQSVISVFLRKLPGDYLRKG